MKSIVKGVTVVLIAIDAMGGDNAPECNVEGALSAAAEWKDTQIVLVGDEARLEPVAEGQAVQPECAACRRCYWF